MDDSSVDLSTPDRQALTALLSEYAEGDEPVKSGRLATLLDRTEGSIKNQMRQLGTMGLVESVPGPRGGYEPTDRAYELLDRDPDAAGEDVILAGGYDRVDVTIDAITLSNVHHPTECRARIHFQQLLADVAVGDPLALGPTPEFELVILGEVVAIVGNGDEIIVDVGEMQAPFRE